MIKIPLWMKVLVEIEDYTTVQIKKRMGLHSTYIVKILQELEKNGYLMSQLIGRTRPYEYTEKGYELKQHVEGVLNNTIGLPLTNGKINKKYKNVER